MPNGTNQRCPHESGPPDHVGLGPVENPPVPPTSTDHSPGYTPDHVSRIIEQAWYDLLQSLTGLPEVKSGKQKDLAWIITGRLPIKGNCVFNTRFEDGRLEERIAEVLLGFQRRSLPMTWWTGPTTHPLELGLFLARQGLSQGNELFGMALNLLRERKPAPLIPSGITIDRIDHSPNLMPFYRLYAQACRSDRGWAKAMHKACTGAAFRHAGAFKHFAARFRGRIIATSAVFIKNQTAAVYLVGTALQVQETRSGDGHDVGCPGRRQDQWV